MDQITRADSSKNIFIIDDRKEDIELISRAISREFQNIQLTTLMDSEQLLKDIINGDLKKARPSLILIDINMPKVSGLEILKALSEQSEYNRIPRIILSSSDHPKDIDNAYGYKANSFVIKPSSYADLKIKLRDIVNYWLQINTN